MLSLNPEQIPSKSRATPSNPEKICYNKIKIIINYLQLKATFTRKDVETDLNKTQDQARLLLEKWQREQRIIKIGTGKLIAYEVTTPKIPKK